MKMITKGELYQDGDSTGGFIRIWDEQANAVFHTMNPYPLGHKCRSGNAAELVRRWNAFEPDGLVAEMRGALRDMVRWVESGCEGPEAMMRAEAVLAKADKEINHV